MSNSFKRLIRVHDIYYSQGLNDVKHSQESPVANFKKKKKKKKKFFFKIFEISKFSNFHQLIAPLKGGSISSGEYRPAELRYATLSALVSITA